MTMSADATAAAPAKPAQKPIDDLYAREEAAARQARSFLEAARDTPEAARGALSEILAAFESLLRETKVLVRQADRRDLHLKQMNVKLKQQFEELNATQTRLRHAERRASLSLLVAGVAHEVNTPVGVCVTATSHLADTNAKMVEGFHAGQVKKSELAAYLKLVGEISSLLEANLQRASELVASFKQVAVDQTSQKRRGFNLKTSIKETLDSMGHIVKHNPQTVVLECPETIAMDSFPGALSQVLINLVMNAHIHAFDESRPGTIRIAAQAAEGEVGIEVTDDGKGIPFEDQGKIFEPFFTTRRGMGGSGLGLHVVYNLVTGPLCGTIEFKSTRARAPASP